MILTRRHTTFKYEIQHIQHDDKTLNGGVLRISVSNAQSPSMEGLRRCGWSTTAVGGQRRNGHGAL